MEEEKREPPPLYIVMTSSASAKGKWTHAARNVAVVKTNEENWPKRIDIRDPAILKIVARWDRLNIGKTERSAYQRYLKEAEAYCAQLNARERPLGTLARAAAEQAGSE